MEEISRGNWKARKVGPLKTQRIMRQSKYKRELDPTIPGDWGVEKSGGYFKLTNAHGHPIASTAGKIPYHRYLAFNKYGADIESNVPCHWCGYEIPWKHSGSCSNDQYKHVVNVDHVDADNTNNDLENLVASCFWCNRSRSLAQFNPLFWETWREFCATTPPEDRPNLKRLAIELGIMHPLKTEEKKP
jgi:hypothetical protein